MDTSLQRLGRSFDNPAALLLLIVAVLLSLGLITLYSASGARAGLENIRVTARAENRAEEDYRFHHSSSYLQKQVMWAGLGLVAAIALSMIPLELLERHSRLIIGITFFVLLLVLVTPLGVESKGARRWMRLGPLTIQPSEFAKIGLVVFMAAHLAQKREEIRKLKSGFLPLLGIMFVFCVLIILERDLGTIMLMGTVVTAMWCLAQVKFRHLATIVLLALPVVAVLILKESYRINRVLAFLYPDKYALTIGLQLNQSLIAVGSGGILGPGFGFGLQKYHFLPESHTDFVFAIVCEELGLIGAIGIVVLFLAFIVQGLRISYLAPDYFSGLLAAGLTLIVGCAAFINFCVVLGMAPTKGLPLPLFSYGGSSIVASLCCIGLLVNIANVAMRARGSKEAF
ncbi:stage V sporulation protein E [bacterium]|nr:stage V sporulation protein E [bacterium]